MRTLFALSVLTLSLMFISPAQALFGGGKKDKQDRPPVTSCGTPGDICSDGTLLIGLYCPDEGENMRTCARLFTVPFDQGRLITWKSKDFKDDIKDDSTKDGDSNQGQANPIDKYPAFMLCNKLTYADYDDWYLPSKKELSELFQVRGTIGDFASQSYWSSSEEGNRTAWGQNFASGSSNPQSKNQKLNVRCIRQEKVHKDQ